VCDGSSGGYDCSLKPCPTGDDPLTTGMDVYMYGCVNECMYAIISFFINIFIYVRMYVCMYMCIPKVCVF